MSHYEDIERPLYASELFKAFKLNIISNHRSNFLSSEKLDTSISFEVSLFYVDDWGGGRPSFNISFKSPLFDVPDGFLSGRADDFFEKRFEPFSPDEDTRGPSPYMQFDLKRRKKVKDKEPDYYGTLVDKMTGFEAETYTMKCWILHDKETGSQYLDGTLTRLEFIEK